MEGLFLADGLESRNAVFYYMLKMLFNQVFECGYELL
jgi:hypothetical protein